MERLPQQPLINNAVLSEFDTFVAEMPPKRESLPTAGSCWAALASQPKPLELADAAGKAIQD